MVSGRVPARRAPKGLTGVLGLSRVSRLPVLRPGVGRLYAGRIASQGVHIVAKKGRAEPPKCVTTWAAKPSPFVRRELYSGCFSCRHTFSIVRISRLSTVFLRFF